MRPVDPYTIERLNVERPTVERLTVEPLTVETQKHWGLLATPFSCDPLDQVGKSNQEQTVRSPDFYFRSTPHARMWRWLQDELACEHTDVLGQNAGPRLIVVKSQIGAGISMAIRQIAMSRGIGDLAIETVSTIWRNQRVEHLFAKSLRNRATMAESPRDSKRSIQNLHCVHAFWSSQVNDLRNWVVANGQKLGNTTVMIRIEDHAAASHLIHDLPTFHLHRTDASELERCLIASLCNAGGTVSIFTSAAIARLIRITDGSYRDLAATTHDLLSWAHAHRFDIIGADVVGQFSNYHQPAFVSRVDRQAA